MNEARAQRFPFEQLHDSEGTAVALPDIEDREDVGMRQRRNRT